MPYNICCILMPCQWWVAAMFSCISESATKLTNIRVKCFDAEQKKGEG